MHLVNNLFNAYYVVYNLYHILLVILFNWRWHSHKQTCLLKQLYDLFNIIQNTTLNVLLKGGIKSTPLNLQSNSQSAFYFHRGTKGTWQKRPTQKRDKITIQTAPSPGTEGEWSTFPEHSLTTTMAITKSPKLAKYLTLHVVMKNGE